MAKLETASTPGTVTTPLKGQPAVPSGQPDRRISDLLHDLGPMQEATDVADLYAGLARAVVGALHADACLISILDTSGKVLKDSAASVVPPARLNLVAEEYNLVDYPATRSALESGGSVEVSVTDDDGDVGAEKALLKQLGFARVLICRLAVDGRAIGSVATYRLLDRAFRHDDPKQVSVLSTFAANVYSRIQLAEKLESQYTVTLEALVSALEARDPYTHQHTGRIRDMASALGVAMQIPAEARRSLRLGSILHDVGKIGISDSILLKPGSLTDEEFETMKAHPLIGERMLRSIDFLEPALPIIRHHHERWDGKGYPDGLAGEDIPIGARIVAVCDSFDAMTSDRPYRKAMPVEAACEELLSCAGGQFDPACAALLVDIINSVGEEHLEERFIRYAS